MRAYPFSSAVLFTKKRRGGRVDVGGANNGGAGAGGASADRIGRRSSAKVNLWSTAESAYAGGAGGASESVAEVRAALARLRRSAGNTAQLVGLESAIDRLLESLGGDLMTADEAAVLLDGTWEGAGADFHIVLRIDLAELDTISGDLFTTIAGHEAWLASFRTWPGLQSAENEGPLPLLVHDRGGNESHGTLEFAPPSGGAASVSGILLLDGPVSGLPAGQELGFSAVWRRSAFRRLGLEIEAEQGVPTLEPILFQDGPLTIETAFANAGIEIFDAGVFDELPPSPADGWHESELDALMRRAAQTPLDRPAFELRLLWMSRSTRRGLMGIMFDSADDLPRQGAAVFAQTIRDHYPHFRELALLNTTVHELGHALNLVHRFERAVGRRDSYSFMNYDWHHPSGQQTYWRDFTANFDADELDFLRHGPRDALIPGGRPFHSVPYWTAGHGAYVPYFDEVPLTGLDLRLIPPSSGTHFAYGQPVFLTVELTNQTQRTLRLPGFLLDPKAGFLEIVITRLDRSNSEPTPFQSIHQRCFERLADGDIVLPPGGTYRDNLQIHFGSSGFAFAEPGRYEIRVVLALFERQLQAELLAWSPPLNLRIAYPKTTEEEIECDLLFSSSVGRWFALGGTDALPDVAEKLKALVEEREGRKQFDGVVAFTRRSIGLNLARDFVRLDKPKAARRKAKPEQAAKQLQAVLNEPRLAACLDPETKRTTEKHAESLAGSSKRGK